MVECTILAPAFPIKAHAEEVFHHILGISGSKTGKLTRGRLGSPAPLRLVCRMLRGRNYTGSATCIRPSPSPLPSGGNYLVPTLRRQGRKADGAGQ